jgi:protoporphyrinogen oxidase
MTRHPHTGGKTATTSLAILGGGPAGLAAGYYAARHQVPFTVFEAAPHVGGNCITLRHGDFLIDSGAHRLHDQDHEATQSLQSMLGSHLRQINVPSLIYSRGKFIDFPLSPLNLARGLGLPAFATAGLDLVRANLSTAHRGQDFESFAIRTYGRTLANRFLLNYSEKLWGVTCRTLSPGVAGKRMKGLSFKTFVTESLFGSKTKTRHLDGAFHYPTHGIGMIPDALAAACGPANVRCNARITGLSHNGSRITTVTINDNETNPVNHVVSTLPLDQLTTLLSPRLPDECLALANRLRYRHVLLVALFLDRPSVTSAATLYFPDPEFPFTRIYEPRNRSVTMAPPGKTSLVIEVPCQETDAVWTLPDRDLVNRVTTPLLTTGLFGAADILDSRVYRMLRAYPVLESGFEEKRDRLLQHLGRFDNLSFSGRCGRFAYAHLHDLMRWGREIVAAIP